MSALLVCVSLCELSSLGSTETLPSEVSLLAATSILLSEMNINSKTLANRNFMGEWSS